MGDAINVQIITSLIFKTFTDGDPAGLSSTPLSPMVINSYRFVWYKRERERGIFSLSLSSLSLSSHSLLSAGVVVLLCALGGVVAVRVVEGGNY